MAMTRDEILALKPGPELDEAVGKLIGATPQIKWYVMNEDETAYCMNFERENTARGWLADNVSQYPNSRYKEYHVVKKEIYKRYSEDMGEAWKVIDHLRQQGLLIKMIDRHAFIKVKFYRLLEAVDTREWAECRDVTEAICKAALISLEVPK